MKSSVKKIMPYTLLCVLLGITACSSNQEQPRLNSEAGEHHAFVFNALPGQLVLELSDNRLSTQQTQKMNDWLARRVLGDVTLSVSETLSPKAHQQIQHWMANVGLVGSQYQVYPKSIIKTAKSRSLLVLTEWSVSVSGCDKNPRPMNFTRLHSSNFSCTTRQHQVAMVSVKADLARGRHLSSSLGVQAVSAVSAYNSGNPLYDTDLFNNDN